VVRVGDQRHERRPRPLPDEVARIPTFPHPTPLHSRSSSSPSPASPITAAGRKSPRDSKPPPAPRRDSASCPPRCPPTPCEG
jgi:hypothetical protein